jgi:hypothetical protein
MSPEAPLHRIAPSALAQLTLPSRRLFYSGETLMDVVENTMIKRFNDTIQLYTCRLVFICQSRVATITTKTC